MILKESIVTIIGPGLMGGSLGMALVKADVCKEVRALALRKEAAKQAIQMKAAHVASTQQEKMLYGTDIIIFAAPVRTIEGLIPNLEPYFKQGAVITDLGSTKTEIMEVMKKLPQTINPIGGHPMCGKELSGIAFADPNLFQNRVWIFTPLDNTTVATMELMSELANKVGAKPLFMSPQHHDLLVAYISHLPYMLASTLVWVAWEVSQSNPDLWELAAGGFRDTSRIAAGDINMMIDILFSNKQHILEAIRSSISSLERFAQWLDESNESELRRQLSQIQYIRTSLFQQ